MSGTSEPLLRVEGLKTYFRSPLGLVRAVDGVSVILQKGQTLGVVGESGSGKTILSRSIMNILPRKATVLAGGQVLFQGTNLRSLSERQMRQLWGPELALVFQDPMTALNPVLKIGAQLTESLRLHMNLSRAQAYERAEHLLREVGIPAPVKRLNEYPHQLSGGMRQRVVIAIALACSPSLLIADEPTTALDVTVQKQILDLLGCEQRERNMGMILVTHDLGVVATRADHIAVMYAGRIVEYAPTDALFRSMRHPYTQALLQSIPRINYPSHTRLQAIPGQPPSLVDPPVGCRFAPRCRYAQPRCHQEDPPETADLGLAGSSTAEADAVHRYACFYPVGTQAGEQALVCNIEAGRNASGMPVMEARMHTPVGGL
jgi:peptide/nickel transport system ATP-binding protein